MSSTPDRSESNKNNAPAPKSLVSSPPAPKAPSAGPRMVTRMVRTTAAPVLVSSTSPVPLPSTGPVPKAPSEQEAREGPEGMKPTRFSYHFHDKVINHPNVKILPENHKLRLQIGGINPKLFLDELKLKLPSAYSLEKYAPVALDQGSYGTCVANSMVQAVKIVQTKKRAEQYAMTKMFTSSAQFNGSRMYIYDNARRRDGTSLYEDVGTTNYSACLAVEEHKICDESVWPYTSENLHRPPSHEAFVDAARFKRFGYDRVSSSLDGLKMALSEGNPVMIGIVVYPSMVQAGFRGRTIPRPSEDSEAPIGGHSVLAIGYDNQKEVISILNHWSPRWGDKGVADLPYNFITKYSGDFWAIKEFGQ